MRKKPRTFKKEFITIFKLVVLVGISSAQPNNFTNKYLLQESQKGNFGLKYHPGIVVGTHINQFSYKIEPTYKFTLSEKSQINLKLNTEIRLNERYLGLEGTSFGAVSKLQVQYSFGKNPTSFNKNFYYKDLSKNNFTYYFAHYASTDKTNQFSGGINYTAVFKKSMLSIWFENDYLAWLGYDEYRTGATSIDYRFLKKNIIWGLGIGAIFWTGSTKGLKKLNYGEEYDMSKQHGADYSHGILFLNFHYQNITLSLGYDSDKIRTTLQNPIHRWLDDGTIPKGELSKDRFYFQLKLFVFDNLY